MQTLIKDIEQWGYDRGIHYLNPLLQTLKLLEECMELQEGIIKYEEELESKCYKWGDDKELLNYLDDIKDAIGDIFCALVILSIQVKSINMLVDLRKARNCDIYEYPRPLVLTQFMVNQVISIQNKLSFDTYPITHQVKDILHVLYEISETYDFTLKECVEHAYNEIKDRKGKIVDGKWVKEIN